MKFTLKTATLIAFVGYAIAAGYGSGSGSGGYGAASGVSYSGGGSSGAGAGGSSYGGGAGGAYGGGSGAAAAPKPYQFDYNAADDKGNTHYRQEQGDANGAVKGTYGYTDVQGLYRIVEYVADKNGFRANIKTNEPGTDGKESPADVIMTVENPPAGLSSAIGGNYGGAGSGGYGGSSGSASGFSSGAGYGGGAKQGAKSGKSGY